MSGKEVFLGETIVRGLEKFGDRNVFYQKKGYRTFSITGNELVGNIGKLLSFLKKQGFRRGDKLLIVGSNSIEWISVFYACVLSGVVVVPLDVLSDITFLKKVQKQVKAKGIFLDRGLKLNISGIEKWYLDDLDKVLQGVKSVEISTNLNVDRNDLVEILYTSGSTGDPKGVMLSYGNVESGVEMGGRVLPSILSLKMLNLLPFSHIFGQIFGLFVLPLKLKHEVYFSDTLHTRKLIRFIRRKRIQGAMVVPEMLDSLKKSVEHSTGNVSQELGSQFRYIGVGGASLDLDLERWWADQRRIVIQGYGLTESSSIGSFNTLFSRRKGSVGKPVKGVELKLGEDGEILLKGENITQGYYKDEKKTKETLRDDWLYTGDVGELKNSYLYIKERKKDVIVKSSGLNIYPSDIETVLNGVDGVKESSVLELNEKIHAVVILQGRESLSKVVEKANRKLLSHQKIGSFSEWPDAVFPKTTTGKVKKFVVAETLEKQKKKESKKFVYDKEFYRVVHDALDVSKKIQPGMKLVDLGMDSLKRVELVSELEQEFGVEIDEAKLTQSTKVADLEELMQEKVKGRVRFLTWPLSGFARFVRFIGQNLIVYPIVRLFVKTEYVGLENLRNLEGDVILASNHQSAFDVPLILHRVDKKVSVAAFPGVLGIDKDFWGSALKGKVYGFLLKLFYNTYPFGESIGTDESLSYTGELLDRGRSILIFPEGERTKDGKIQEFKQGVGYLALQIQEPIVPVKIEGLHEVLPRGKFWPKSGKVKIVFGKPILPDEFKDKEYRQVTKIIEKKIRSL